jgi:tetratricopeptide (TPR) repeat protein
MIRFPFMNIYTFADGASFTVDFYHPPDAPDYAARFSEGWHQLRRQLPLRPRGQPFLLTECPSCGTVILTGRKPGRSLNCRVCETGFEVHALPRSSYAALLDEVLDEIGRCVVDISGQTQVVVLQAPDEGTLDAARAACESMGFHALPQDDRIAGYLWMEGMQRGVFQLHVPHIAAGKVASDGQTAFEDETPPDVEDLLDSLAELEELQSLSGVVDPSSEFARGLDFDELQAKLDQDPRNLQTLRLLVEALVADGRLAEARARAQEALALADDDPDLWTSLGRIELREERWADAASALERALALDPTDRFALLCAAVAYERLGQPERSADASARLAALGGPG